MKLVSVIVPVYNSEKYLKECVESILNQTYTNIELILVDDGSGDLSGEICREYEKKDQRVIYIHKENGGVSSARNTGMRIAKGEYIAFVDSDDFISEDMFSNLISIEADFAMCGYELYDDMIKTPSFRYACKELFGDIGKLAMNVEDYLSPPFLLGPWCKLFKTEIIRINSLQFPPDLSYGEDAVFVFDYLQKCSTISINSYVGYSYRKHSNLTLSRKFRTDKIDINKRINNLIESFMKLHKADNTDKVIANRMLDNFVSYTQDLIKSELSYSDKRRVFNKKYHEYGCGFAQPKRVAQRIVVVAGKCRLCYWLIYLFAIKG